MSMICCLEDSIRDDQVPAAEQHLIAQLRRFAATETARSGGRRARLLFVRVRNSGQIYRVAEGLGSDLECPHRVCAAEVRGQG